MTEKVYRAKQNANTNEGFNLDAHETDVCK
jgi:hypothetical protein